MCVGQHHELELHLPKKVYPNLAFNILCFNKNRYFIAAFLKDFVTNSVTNASELIACPINSFNFLIIVLILLAGKNQMLFRFIYYYLLSMDLSNYLNLILNNLKS